MKKSPIWDQLAHTPVLNVIAVEHRHDKSKGKCATHQTLAANDTAHGMKLHVFHDDFGRLYVVKLPSA